MSRKIGVTEINKIEYKVVFKDSKIHFYNRCYYIVTNFVDRKTSISFSQCVTNINCWDNIFTWVNTDYMLIPHKMKPYSFSNIWMDTVLWVLRGKKGCKRFFLFLCCDYQVKLIVLVEIKVIVFCLNWPHCKDTWTIKIHSFICKNILFIYSIQIWTQSHIYSQLVLYY